MMNTAAPYRAGLCTASPSSHIPSHFGLSVSFPAAVTSLDDFSFLEKGAMGRAY
jgi:hypothetical protein